MSEYCEILVTEWEAGQVSAGQIIFEGGKLRFTATKGYEVLMKTIVEDKTIVRGKVFDPATDPQAWLRSLPSAYTGSILRARLVSSEPRSKWNWILRKSSNVCPQMVKLGVFESSSKALRIFAVILVAALQRLQLGEVRKK